MLVAVKVKIMENIFRIKKYSKGWVVEIQKRKWYGKRYWTHFVSVAGIESKPWHYSTFDYAVMGLQDEVKFQAFRNVRVFG
jgi:hypothetical protein